MKLENIYYLCKKYCDIVSNIEATEVNRNYYVDRIEEVRQAIKQLAEIDCLKVELQNFSSKVEEVHGRSSILFENPFESLREANVKLCVKMNTILAVCESMDLHIRETPGLDMKIPDCDNFTDFKKIINEIEFIVTKCPFAQHETESLRFEGVDVGTQWISFAISGVAAVATGSILLNNIAAFVDKCIIIRSHYLTTKQQKLEIERSSIEQGEKDELLKNINRIYKIHIENTIKELEKETGCKISDGDERGRAEQSLQKMGELIDKGLQIYSSIDSPKETKALFEPLEMKYLSIEQELKAIEDKKNRERKKEESDE